MTYIKKILLSSLMIGLSVPLGYTVDPNEGGLDDSSNTIEGTLSLVNGSILELSKFNEYTVDENCMLTITSDNGGQTTLTTEKPITFASGSTLNIRNNSEVTLGNTILNDCTIDMYTSLFSNADGDQYANVSDITASGTYNTAVAPTLTVTGDLKLVGTVKLQYQCDTNTHDSVTANPLVLELEDVDGKSTIDITELEKIDIPDAYKTVMAIKTTANTSITYMATAEEASINDSSVSNEVKARIENLLDSSNPYGLTFTNDNKPTIYDYCVGGAGTITVTCSSSVSECGTLHSIAYTEGGPSSTGWLAQQLDRTTYANFFSNAEPSNFKYELVGASTKTIGGGGVGNFVDLIDNEQTCSTTGNPYIVPNTAANNFVAWPELALPLYPSDGNNTTNFSSTDNDFKFNMNIVDYNPGGDAINLSFDCGTFDEGNSSNNTVSYITKLTFNGDNSGFTQTVNLSGNQIENIVFGNVNGWVNLNLLDATKTEFNLSIADGIANDPATPFKIDRVPTLASNAKLNFDTGKSNYITFVTPEGVDGQLDYEFNKFKLNSGSNVTLNNVKLTI